MQVRQMPEFGQDSTIDPRLGDAPAASCFLPPPSRPPARIPAPSSMYSFADNRSSDAGRATGMQLCTVSIVEEKNAPLPRMPHRASRTDSKPPQQAPDSPESTHPGFRLPKQPEPLQDITREPAATANFDKMCSIHFQRPLVMIQWMCHLICSFGVIWAHTVGLRTTAMTLKLAINRTEYIPTVRHSPRLGGILFDSIIGILGEEPSMLCKVVRVNPSS
ncbi:hypothetical protein B0H13DRAFT_1935915 [Mycena leptocephala]|nr:hypothetical protein B0H13DRAFT_1935915 [Mycena leptocephala]